VLKAIGESHLAALEKPGDLVIGMLFVLACQTVSKGLFDGVRTGREGICTRGIAWLNAIADNLTVKPPRHG
jgi:hypothetical protein